MVIHDSSLNRRGPELSRSSRIKPPWNDAARGSVPRVVRGSIFHVARQAAQHRNRANGCGLRLVHFRAVPCRPDTLTGSAPVFVPDVYPLRITSELSLGNHKEWAHPTPSPAATPSQAPMDERQFAFPPVREARRAGIYRQIARI